MSEIVLAEPLLEETQVESTSTSTSNRPFTRSITLGYGDDEDDVDHVPEHFDSERLPPTLASEIQRFLRVANLIEIDEPRIAYLCRHYVFEIAHNMDKYSTGRGVKKFKTTLLQRLELDQEATIWKRREKSDVRELRRVYHAYKQYIIKHIIKHGGAFELDHREKLINARRIASVLYEILETVAGPQALADRDSIHTKAKGIQQHTRSITLGYGDDDNDVDHVPEHFVSEWWSLRFFLVVFSTVCLGIFALRVVS